MRKPEKERSEGYGGGLIIYKKVISYFTCFTRFPAYPEYRCSARSGTIFKIADPDGDCPEHGHGFFGLMEVTALDKNPVIFL